jgi:hypothetical protein
MREVGNVVSEIFEEERTATRATIDAQLALLKAGAAPAERPPSWLPSAEQRTPTGRPIDRAVVSSGETPAGAAISMQHRPDISVPPDTSGTSKRAPLIIGAAALLLTAIGFALGMSATSKKDPPITAATTSLPTAEPTPVVSNTSPPPSPPTATVDPRPEPTPTPTKVAEKPPEKPVERPRVAWTPPPRPAWTPPPRVATPPPKPPSPAPSPPETKAPDGEDSKGKNGYLTLDTYPWTRVSLGGRVLGDTPIVRLPLAAGTHVLTLENTTENVKKTTVVTIKAGETVSKRLAF